MLERLQFILNLEHLNSIVWTFFQDWKKYILLIRDYSRYCLGMNCGFDWMSSFGNSNKKSIKTPTEFLKFMW